MPTAIGHFSTYRSNENLPIVLAVLTQHNGATRFLKRMPCYDKSRGKISKCNPGARLELGANTSVWLRSSLLSDSHCPPL
jgi:hypothetical protein